jgi:hypothetical protein
LGRFGLGSLAGCSRFLLTRQHLAGLDRFLIPKRHFLATKPAPDGLLDLKTAPLGLGSLAALSGLDRFGRFAPTKIYSSLLEYGS